MNDRLYKILITAKPPTKALEKVLKNLNDMGQCYQFYPEEEAIQEIAAHISTYLAPSVRHQIVEHLKQGGIGMKVIVQMAVSRLDKAA